MDTNGLKILSVISLITTHRSLTIASSTGSTSVTSASIVTTQPTTTFTTTTPTPTIFRNDVNVNSGAVPEWFLIFLALLLTLSLFTAIAGLIWCCCCKASSVYPGVGSVGGSSRRCCPTGRRGSTHHYLNDSPRLQKVMNHTTATHNITGHKRVIYPMDDTEGVYTTNNGLILVPVKPHEANGYVSNSPSPPKRHVHTTNRFNITTSRADNGSNDLKKFAAEVPKWMPHTHGYRNNNTSTH